jgi:hypothetical protein
MTGAIHDCQNDVSNFIQHIIVYSQPMLKKNGQNLKARVPKTSSISSPHWCRSIARNIEIYRRLFFHWRSHNGELIAFETMQIFIFFHPFKPFDVQFDIAGEVLCNRRTLQEQVSSSKSKFNVG